MDISASTVTLVLIIAVVCLTLGLAVGWLLSLLLSSQKKESSRDAGAAKTAPAPAAAETSKALLRFTRKAENGALEVELGGKAIPSADRMSQEERTQMTGLLKEGVAWLGIFQASAPAAPPPAPAPRPARTVVPSVVSANAETPRPSMLGGVTNALADAINPAAGQQKKSLSIVQQIDEILQSRISGTPLEAMKIFMTEDAGNNVIVRVGKMSYQGIGSLPEGEIKELIKSCVQEWERGQEKSQRRT